MNAPDDTRRGRVTDEHREEAARLRALWDAKKWYRVLNEAESQAAFGLKYEVGNQSAVGFFLNGQTALSLKAARGFAIGLGIKIDEFSPRLALQAFELGELATHRPPAVPTDFSQLSDKTRSTTRKRGTNDR